MTPAEEELVAAVASDLQFLQTDWDQSVEDHTVRRSSNVLRALLVDGAYGRAWRLVGNVGEPTIEATDLQVILRGLVRARVRFATAGGAHSGGMTIYGLLEYGDVMEPSMVKQRHERFGGQPPLTEYKFSAFLESLSVVRHGTSVRRREVIKYVANKLGGAHYDTSRRSDEIAARMLDQVYDLYQVADRSAVFFELLSIGQALASSPDAAAFCRLADDH